MEKTTIYRRPKTKEGIINKIFGLIKYNSENHCWEWTGALHNKGYGHMGMNGKIYRVHRLMYEYIYGPIPETNTYHGTCILHRCDNRKCCNPMHLYAGTQKDNIKDCVKRGRRNPNSVYGENHYKSKLTKKDVLEIRKSKDSQIIIAKQFKVSRQTINYIKNRITWKHI